MRKFLSSMLSSLLRNRGNTEYDGSESFEREDHGEVVVEPAYKHDCDRCVFIGRLENFDLYANCDGLGYAWILRGSSEPSDYITTNRLDRYVNKKEKA